MDKMTVDVLSDKMTIGVIFINEMTVGQIAIDKITIN
jgi:hypothetical protein